MLPPYILFTALTAQFFYILVNWFFFRRKEYLYYSLYVIALTLYFLNKYIGDENGIIQMGPVALSKLYPDKILCVLGYIFYFKFGRRFVEVKTRYPSIHKLMTRAEVILFIYILIDIILLATTGYSKFENALFLLVNLSIFIVLIFVFRVMILKNEVLDRFILTGSMFYGISAFITMWMGYKKDPLDNNHIIALQIGAFVEMVFLNAGLVYKSRMLQNQTLHSQSELIKKYEENQDLLLRIGTIREKISRDLHDDLGASLSSIKAYSEILGEHSKTDFIAAQIKNNSTEMIERLEMIAWATNPSHDNFKSLKNRMLKFAVPLCHSRNISFNFKSEEIDEALQIHSDTRQHIFLVFKEAINNMIKYAGATSCECSLYTNKRIFALQITDNGIGFDKINTVNGNGLSNMLRRAEDMGGNLAIETRPKNGTNIHLQIPFPFQHN